MIHLILAILSFAIAIYFLFFSFKKTKSEKEYDQKLKESLDEEYIIDPESGARITLEQAESGKWINHDNEFLTMPESDIENLLTEEDRIIHRALNYLKELKSYRKNSFEEDEIDFLNQSITLSKYDDWTYSDCYKMTKCNGFAFVPEVLIQGRSTPYYSESDYHESQLMFWIKLEIEHGHYFFSEKSILNEISLNFKNNKILQLKGHHSLELRQSPNIIKSKKLLSNFKGTKGLEIEFIDNNLLIKNRKLVNLEDLKRIEKTIKNVC